MNRHRSNGATDRTRPRVPDTILLRRPLLWIALWLALEALAIRLVASHFGLPTTFLLLLAKSGLGLFLVVWMTGRTFLRLPRSGFSMARIERFGFGLLAGLILMLPGFALSIFAFALLSPNVRRWIIGRFAPPVDEGIVNLQPGEWREVEPESPATGVAPPRRP